MQAPRFQGEIMGVVLAGLIRSFRNIYVISGQSADRLAARIKSTEWYPVKRFYELLELLTAGDGDRASVLPRAGMEFIQEWYVENHGSDFIKNSTDFLKFQAASAGYRSVVRGDPRDVGAVDISDLDESQGKAVVVSTSPFPAEFEKGIFYGGMLYPGDLEYVSVRIDQDDAAQGSPKTITIQFRQKALSAITNQIEQLLSEITPSTSPSVPPALAIEVLWKLKALRSRHEFESAFWKQARTNISEIHRLRGILPICCFCKKIRDDAGYWQAVENYIADHSEALLSHGICPACARKHYPDCF